MPGRRAGPTRTRQAILDSARAAFAAHGYDATSIRLVARSAGVDPALVHHFFANKAGLFAAATELPVDPEQFVTHLLAGGRSTLGPRLVRAVVELWDAPGVFEPFLGLIRGAVSHEDAARLLREFVTTEILGRLAVAAAPDHPEARAALAGSQIVGLAMARKIVRIEPLASATPQWLASAVGPTIQRYLTGRLDSPTIMPARPAADQPVSPSR
jgi:AcrR family transcriptional regulator